MRGIKCCVFERPLSFSDVIEKVQQISLSSLSSYYEQLGDARRIKALASKFKRIRDFKIVKDTQFNEKDLTGFLLSYEFQQRVRVIQRDNRSFQTTWIPYTTPLWWRTDTSFIYVPDVPWAPFLIIILESLSRTLFGSPTAVKRRVFSKEQFIRLMDLALERDPLFPSANLTRAVFKRVKIGKSIMPELNMQHPQLQDQPFFHRSLKNAEVWNAVSYVVSSQLGISVSLRLDTKGNLLIYKKGISMSFLNDLFRVLEKV